MFDVGLWEVVLIFLMALFFLGPEKLPKIATQVGRWIGKARRSVAQLKYQLEKEVGPSLDNQSIYTPPAKTSMYIPPAGNQKSTSENPPSDEDGIKENIDNNDLLPK
jgi:Tat protein translocase TatB subunit